MKKKNNKGKLNPQLSSELDAEDRALFRDSVGPVRRHRHDRVDHHRAKSAPVIGKHPTENSPQGFQDMLSDEFVAADVDLGEALFFARPGLQKSVLRKLRMGRIPQEAELDLHGNTVAESRTAVARFINESHRSNRRAVRIVHGKGYRSQQNKPVLKGKINSWLQQCDEVLAFCSAQLADGGTGAVYVLLKRFREEV